MVNIQDIRRNKLIEEFNKRNIDFSTIAYKTILIDFYASKKINLCYSKLKKPKIEYVLITKDNHIISINKTIYYYLADIKEDLTDFIKSCRNEIQKDISLYDRFKGKDYMSMNFLSNSEKNKIQSIELFIKEDYKGYVEAL